MWRNSRTSQTTIPCSLCSTPLKAERACREVTLYCERCDKRFAVRDYFSQMDDALEDFLAAVPCDRV